MNDNPKFYATVEIDGEKIATIKAKTPGDEAEIQDRCYHRVIIDGKIDWQIDFGRMNIIRIRQALTGDPKVGWINDHPVSEANISLLSPDLFSLILEKVTELDKSWADGDVAKN
jgi:hypothetical protein